MDRIDGDRLWLEVLWYDASSKVKSDSPDGSLATARRTNGWRFLLADPEDMEHLVAVYLDDELVMWRESGSSCSAPCSSCTRRSTTRTRRWPRSAAVQCSCTTT